MARKRRKYGKGGGTHTSLHGELMNPSVGTKGRNVGLDFLSEGSSSNSSSPSNSNYETMSMAMSGSSAQSSSSSRSSDSNSKGSNKNENSSNNISARKKGCKGLKGIARVKCVLSKYKGDNGPVGPNIL